METGRRRPSPSTGTAQVGRWCRAPTWAVPTPKPSPTSFAESSPCPQTMFGHSEIPTTLGPRRLKTLYCTGMVPRGQLYPLDPNPRHTLIYEVIAGGTVIPQGNLWLLGVADGFGRM